MRIALVTYALQIGGVETFLRVLATFLTDRGHEVDFVETQSAGLWSKYFSEQGYNVNRIVANALRSRFHHAVRIARVLKKYDAIILNDAPYAQSVLGLLPENVVAIPVLHSNLTSMYKNAVSNQLNWDSVVTVNPGLLNNLVRNFAISENRAICISHGVNVSKEWPKKELQFDDKPLRAFFVGTVSHIPKGVLYLPEIFLKVHKKCPEVILDIFGDGPDLQKLKELFRDTCPDLQTTFHGYVPNKDIIYLLNEADVLIMPSVFEGFPLTPLEAMAAGVVPIISRIPGCTDFMIEDGGNGVLVDIGNELGFAEAIINLAKNRSKLRTMSKAAWEAARQRFSYEIMGQLYLDLIEESRRRREAGETPKRSGEIDTILLGDLPFMPILFVRPVRKMLRMLGLFPKPRIESLLYIPVTK